MAARQAPRRRCPECDHVADASEFLTFAKITRTGYRRRAEKPRTCPSCFFTAPAPRFQVVREKEIHHASN